VGKKQFGGTKKKTGKKRGKKKDTDNDVKVLQGNAKRELRKQENRTGLCSVIRAKHSPRVGH